MSNFWDADHDEQLGGVETCFRPRFPSRSATWGRGGVLPPPKSSSPRHHGIITTCRATKHLFGGTGLRILATCTCPGPYCTSAIYNFSLRRGGGENKFPHRGLCRGLFAEGTRFELVVRLPVRQFSKLLVSATHPPFRKFRLKHTAKNKNKLSRTAKIQKFIVSTIFFVCLY